MPKRIVDGEGVWRSEKLRRVTPAWMRGEFACWLPLMLANGVAEIEPRRVWSQIYAFNRSDISVTDVQKILREFNRCGLIFMWLSEGKLWGYFVGSHKPGRLPPASRLKKHHELLGPIPPAEGLEKYVESTRAETLDGQWLANGSVGFGFGFGSGSGSGNGHVSGGVAVEENISPSTDGKYSFHGKFLKITPRQHDRLRTAYPDLDVAACYAQMDLWLEAAGVVRKNLFLFARNWLAKERKIGTSHGQNPRIGIANGAVAARHGKYGGIKQHIISGKQ